MRRSCIDSAQELEELVRNGLVHDVVVYLA